MFVLTTKISAVDRGIAAVLAVAMVSWAVGAHYTAQAAGLTSVSDVLSTSAPNTAANHTISFTLPAGSAGIDQDDEIRITIPTGFGNVGNINDDDIDVAVDSTDIDTTADWNSATSGQQIIITAQNAGGMAVAGEEIEIEIGTNAQNESGGTDQITNHSATGSYEMLIEVYNEGATLQDSASTILVVVDQVTVTADVDPIFNFFVTGTTTGTVLDSETMTATTTDTAIPFGTLTNGTPGIAAQELRVVTNAVGGFGVTVFTDQQLTASNFADIDSFADGADTAVPTTWASPTGTIGSENTYGHWGVRSTDESNLTLDFSTDDEYVALPLASGTPLEVFTHTEPVDGFNSALGAGYAQVMYKAEIMSFQEAADDYTATLTYVATPSF